MCCPPSRAGDRKHDCVFASGPHACDRQGIASILRHFGVEFRLPAIDAVADGQPGLRRLIETEPDPPPPGVRDRSDWP